MNIKETLTCALARSILVYIHCHNHLSSRLWDLRKIDLIESLLFRKVNGFYNIIRNKAILNVAFSMRNAIEVVE